jgi:hypothetical protein
MTDEYAIFGEMRIGRGNPDTRRKQVPYHLTRIEPVSPQWETGAAEDNCGLYVIMRTIGDCSVSSHLPPDPSPIYRPWDSYSALWECLLINK